MNTNHHKDKDNDNSTNRIVNPLYALQNEDWQVSPVTVSTIKARFDSLSPLLVMNRKEELFCCSCHSGLRLLLALLPHWVIPGIHQLSKYSQTSKCIFGFIPFVFRPNPCPYQRSLREKVHVTMLHSCAAGKMGIKGDTQVIPIGSENSYD